MADTNRSKIFGLAAVVALAAGLWWWLGRGGDEVSPAGDAASVAAANAESGSVAVGREALSGAVDPWKAPRAVVTGTVRDDAGQPIGGAQVCAMLDDTDVARVDRHPPHCTTTREDGTYRLGELLGAQHSLHASARGYVPARYRYRRGIQNRLSSAVELQAGATREGVDFVLESGGVEVDGVVKDIAGGVIEGAWVSAGGDWRGGGQGGVFTRSDDEGRFSLWVEPPDVRVRAFAEGYSRSSRSAAAPGTFVEVFLTPESVVVGKVVWAQTGEPVAGARVSASGSLWWGSRGTVFSGEDGSFRLEGLDPGSYKLQVSGETLTGRSDEKIHVGLGETSEAVVVVAHPAFSVRGTVMVDEKTPCSGARVTLEDTVRKDERSATGGGETDGSVLIEGVLPGTYEVSVRCNGYVPDKKYPEIVVADASLDGLNWSVHEGQTIRGTVVDAAGEPVKEARVSARAKANKDPRAQHSNSWGDRTEADGAFELGGLLPGTYELVVFHEQLPRPDERTKVELPEGADLDDITITLPQSGHVEGIVRDEKGNPVSGVMVSIRGLRWGDNASTNDEGRFVEKDVKVGEYRLVARRGWSETMRAPGATDDDDAGERITVRSGETTEVELVVESQGGRITGRVLGEGGEPIADAFVDAVRERDSAAASEGRGRQRVRWGGWDEQPVLTDDEGRFELANLAEGATYSVYANRKGGGEAIAEHVAEGSDVDLSIGEVGVLAGVVRIDGGGFPEEFRVQARDREGGFSQSDQVFRTEGRWRLSNMPSGKYEVVVDASEGNAKVEVELAEGEQKSDVELVLTPRVTLLGTLVDAETGEPVPGLKVNVSGEGGQIRFSRDGKADQPDVSDAQGKFEIASAPTGKVTLMMMSPNFSDSDYGWTRLSRRIPTTPQVQDLGTLELVARRVERGEEPGDLGFKVKESEPGSEPEDRRQVVAFVHPGGPADTAGLKVGDEIATVDGQDVQGLQSYRFGRLTRATPGTKLTLGVVSGEQKRPVELVVGAPR